MTKAWSAERLLGNADCERLSDGLLSQPVAAVSSLSFVVAGAWLASRRPWSGREPIAATVYAGLVTLVGAGSVAYHGTVGAASTVLHDGSIALVVLVAAMVPSIRMVRRKPVWASGSSRALSVAAVAGTAGALAYAVGRTGAAWCQPESLLQPHAVYHCLMAVVLAAWGAALWEPSPRSGSGSGSGSDATAGRV